MKIAFGIDGNKIHGHFGECNDFRIVELDNNNQMISTKDIHDDVHVHSERPQFLKNLGVDLLVMNGIRSGAHNRLVALNIQTLDAQNMNVDEALQAYLNGSLTKSLEAQPCAGCDDDHHHNH